MANTTKPSMCGGDAAFLSNYFDHLLLIIKGTETVQVTPWRRTVASSP